MLTEMRQRFANGNDVLELLCLGVAPRSKLDYSWMTMSLCSGKCRGGPRKKKGFAFV